MVSSCSSSSSYFIYLFLLLFDASLSLEMLVPDDLSAVWLSAAAALRVHPQGWTVLLKSVTGILSLRELSVNGFCW